MTNQAHDPSQPLPNAKQERFCREVLIDDAIEEAGERAGYTKDYARKLATKPYIIARIDHLRKERGDRLQVDADRVLREFEAIAFLSWEEIKNLDGIVKASDKIQALTKLGNHLGLFKKKVEVTGKGGGPVEVQTVDKQMGERILAATGAIEADLAEED